LRYTKLYNATLAARPPMSCLSFRRTHLKRPAREAVAAHMAEKHPPALVRTLNTTPSPHSVTLQAAIATLTVKTPMFNSETAHFSRPINFGRAENLNQ
jgi:hypothetical protein